MKKYTYLFIFILALFACEPNQSVDSPELREEVENRKIKQIHEPEILERALKIGNEVSLKSEVALGKSLKSQIGENGIAKAISFCNVNSIPIIKDLEKEYDVTIKRVSMKNRNPNNKPSGIEFKLYDSYLYNQENGLESTESIQKNGDEYIYVKPIFVKDLCLNCHGIIDTNITPENHLKINELYPDDLATGYSVGDLRGMWSVVMTKKKVILEISDDTWKHKKLRNPRTKTEKE